MLGDFDTGYEGKFDFPLRDSPPERVYLLATVPRTGSTYFSHLLWRTGCLGAPLEYLNFSPTGPYGFASGSPENQRGLWRSVLRRRTSPNGVFGIKGFPIQLQELQEVNPALLSEVFAALFLADRPRRVVHLARRDRVAHLVSYARANLSGVWREEQERAGSAPAPEYSEPALAMAARLIDSQAAAWEEMFAELGIEPLRLWYEDVVAAPAEAIDKVAAYMGVLTDPAAAVSVPEIRKQAEGGSRAWAERHAAARDGTGS
jgi:LPS sulfotransferase NodH